MFQPQTPIVAQRQRSVDPAEQSEVNALRAENSDLKERLEVLRQKSKQEHLELERAKIQLQQLTEFKNEITEAHTALKRTLEERQKVRAVDNICTIRISGVGGGSIQSGREH